MQIQQDSDSRSGVPVQEEKRLDQPSGRGSDANDGYTGDVDGDVDVDVDVDAADADSASAAAAASVQEANRQGGDGDIDIDDYDEEHKPALPFSKARCIALVLTVTGAAFVNTVGIQAIVILLPTIGRELDIPTSRQQWLVSSYSLTFGCFLLVWGRIADIYGKRLIFIWGSVWFTAVTAATPFIPDEIAFNLFRGLQGIGAAANVPTAIGILGVTFPPGKAKNYAFSTYSAGAPLGAVFGNIFSGLIAGLTNWRWVFGVLAIMAGLISVAGIFIIPRPPPSLVVEKKARTAAVDWIGAVLVTGGLLGVLFALTEGNVVGWRTPWIPVVLVASLAVVGLFVVWQWYLENRTRRRPLMKVSMFRNRRFSAVMAIMFLTFATFNNFVILVTYWLQDYKGYSPLQTMLRFIPTGASGVVVAAITSLLLARVPTAFIMMTGTGALCISSLLFAVPIPPDTNYFAWAFWALILSVVGSDTAWPCLMLFTSHALPSEDQALGGALINAVGQLGRAIGLAICTAVQTAVMARERHVSVEDAGPVMKGDAASLTGIRAGSWLNVGLGGLGFLVVVAVFRSKEIVGKPTSRRTPRSGGEEGIMNQEELDEERPTRAST